MQGIVTEKKGGVGVGGLKEKPRAVARMDTHLLISSHCPQDSYTGK
jgi:hypothetical protein